MSHDGVQYKMRLPDELHSQLAAVAKKSGRSLSSEIIERLKSTLENNSVSTVELKALGGVEKKPLDCNAVEIAEKVVELLSKPRQKSGVNQVIIFGNRRNILLRRSRGQG